MTRYLALLRGINVAGKNSIRMPALQDSVAGLGFQEVQTYLQSGNIVFRTAQTDQTVLAAMLKAKIARDFGFEVPVLVISAKELAITVNANPLWPDTGGDEALYHSTFLFQPVAGNAVQVLQLPAAEGERVALVGHAVLLHCPHGYGKTKLNNSYFERALGVPATTRNWRTVLALHALCSTLDSANHNI